jgi:hypothetical protein
MSVAGWPMCRCAVSRPDGNRHRFDPAALLAGLLFLSVAGWYGSAAFSDLRIPVVIAVPGLLIALSVVGFVRVATRSRRR